MSNVMFPKLRGLKWDITRKPMYNTQIQKTPVPGEEVRISYSSQPQYEISLAYEWLPQRNPNEDGNTDLEIIEGFFNQRGGAFDSFLLNPSDLTQEERDSVVQGANIGVGDGAKTAFQITRVRGGFTEECYAPQSVEVLVDGVAVALTADYTLTNGFVVFVAAPAVGAVITVNFVFCYIVRFRDDAAEFNNFMFRLWELQQIALVSLRP